MQPDTSQRFAAHSAPLDETHEMSDSAEAPLKSTAGGDFVPRVSAAARSTSIPNEPIQMTRIADNGGAQQIRFVRVDSTAEERARVGDNRARRSGPNQTQEVNITEQLAQITSCQDGGEMVREENDELLDELKRQPSVQSSEPTTSLPARRNTINKIADAAFHIENGKMQDSIKATLVTDELVDADREALLSGEALPVQHKILSEDGKFCLALRSTGDLVVVQTDKCDDPHAPVKWSSQTAGLGRLPFKVSLKTSGNLVIFSNSGTVNEESIWDSGTSGVGSGPYCLAVTTDGYAEILDNSNMPVWVSSQHGVGRSNIDTIDSMDKCSVM